MTNQSPRDQSSLCPQCDQKGSKVKRITLESLLKPDSAGLITDEQFRFCDSVDCETVYFGDNGTTFAKQNLTVRVGVKEHSAPRHVCYCFDHTIEEINAEVNETGSSTVLDDIKTRMKEACWCETQSPQGSCCLGTVGKYVKIALAENGVIQDSSVAEEEPADCCAVGAHCSSPSNPEGVVMDDCCSNTDTDHEVKDKSQRIGMLAVGGSVFSALAASACCWIPLLLIVFGVSAGGVSAWFEQYRWLFLGITTVLLGSGFYLVYFRKPHCAPGAACATPNLKLQRFNRGMLWIATVVVVVTAAFPKYVGYLIPDGEAPKVVDASISVKTALLPIEGMTCEACTIHVKSELAKVPGVLGAIVSYEDGNASITFDSEAPPTTADLNSAIEKAGYTGDASSMAGP